MKDQIVEEVIQIRIKIELDCEKSGISYKDHLLSVHQEYESRMVTGSTFNRVQLSCKTMKLLWTGN